MNLQSIPAFMMAAVCLYVAFFYLKMYLLRKHEREFLTFSMSCFSVFIYDITCAGLYNSTGIEQGVFWQRGNFIGVSLVSTSLIWFISDFTRTRIGRRAALLTLFYMVMISVFIFMDNSLVLTALNPSIKHITIDKFLNITYYETDPGILCSIFLLITILSVVYLIHMLINYNRFNPDRKAGKIIISFCMFFIGVFSDMMVSTGIYDFVYISEYIFMFIILVMGYTLQINFVTLQRMVENLNANLEAKVNERTIELIEKQKKIEEENIMMAEWRAAMDIELNMARSIQQQIIPENNPADFISAMFKPMAPVGGDFYDFIKFRENDLIGIFISDVSGHGIPSALITTMIKSLISGAGGTKVNPAQLLTSLNETLVKQSGDNFVTAFYGIYDMTKKTITYSSAGHNPPFLIYNNKISQLDKAKSLPLGIYTNEMLAQMNKSYTSTTDTLPANSKLLLYTDGLTETQSMELKNHYFENIMDGILFKNSALSSRQFVSNLYKELVNFRGNENFEDDVCIICVNIE